jgi:hypothetical protein
MKRRFKLSYFLRTRLKVSGEPSGGTLKKGGFFFVRSVEQSLSRRLWPFME